MSSWGCRKCSRQVLPRDTRIVHNETVDCSAQNSVSNPIQGVCAVANNKGRFRRQSKKQHGQIEIQEVLAMAVHTTCSARNPKRSLSASVRQNPLCPARESNTCRQASDARIHGDNHEGGLLQGVMQRLALQHPMQKRLHGCARL